MDTSATTSLIRPELLTLSSEQLELLMPYFWVFGGIIFGLVVSVLKFLNPKWPTFFVTLATCVMGIVSSLAVMHRDPQALFNGMMISDRYSLFFNILFLSCTALTALASFRYLDREGLQHPEYYLLLLFSASGMMVMTSARDLVVVFIGLEIMSLAVYALVGFRRADRRSNEAAIKYFILGSAASAILLFGSALLYGATGSLLINDILTYVQSGPQAMTPLYLLGTWLVLIGFLFKVASVPFHMWMPDVYEGAPAPITGFMTTGLKAAAFATLVRVFISLGYGKGLGESVGRSIHDVLWVSAVLTMLVGNLIAMTQTNLKRMLAYSSIAHSGYLLVGLITGATGGQGFAPVVAYLVAYSVMNLGAFVVLTSVAGRGDEGLNLHDLTGLAYRRPGLAFAMSVFLFSMAGLPPTAGFASKYLLLSSAVQGGELPLVIIAVLCSALSVFYYLRVMVYMYMKDPLGEASTARLSVWSTAVLAATVALTLIVGLSPRGVITAAVRAVASL